MQSSPDTAGKQHTITSSQYHANSTLPPNAKLNIQVNYFPGMLKHKNASAQLTQT